MKSLKDLDFELINSNGGKYIDSDRNSSNMNADEIKKELREVAKEWIKLLDGQDCINSVCQCDNCNTVKWIERFFNIE